MGLLNQDERQKLIDLLCQLPEIDTYPHVRAWLVATLPEDLRNSIVYVNAAKFDVANIVDMVSSDAWCQLPDDSYPVLIVIVNAISMVRGSRLAGKLHKLMNILRDKFGLPPIETLVPKFTQSLPDQFMQRLYHFIQIMPALKIVLDDVHEAFSRYIIKPVCHHEQVRLTRICIPVREFLTILQEEQSNDLKVQAYGLALKSALLGFNKQEEETKKRIGHFCEKYGIVIWDNQPVDAREDIQRQIDILVQRHESVFKSAERLYNQLCSP